MSNVRTGLNQPGHGAVPSSRFEVERELRADGQGIALYLTAVIVIGVALAVVAAMAIAGA